MGSHGGSSTLTRGKHAGRVDPEGFAGLIPAHAGKTADCLAPSRTSGAHPRSRGENSLRRVKVLIDNGSSPLTRGKPDRLQRREQAPGLIPAHAGKTIPDEEERDAALAHPRSRGENAEPKRDPLGVTGSSPLTRGKLQDGLCRPLIRRLIPAHAGKTL